MWQAATEDSQASLVARYLGRLGSSGGRVTSRIGYTNREGVRIIRTWDDTGNMVEIEEGKRTYST